MIDCKHIYKFNLVEAMGNEEGATYVMAKHGRIIHVHSQNEQPCIWVEFEDDDEFVDRTFVVAGTGWFVKNDLAYVGTVHLKPFVWHIYEVMS